VRVKLCTNLCTKSMLTDRALKNLKPSGKLQEIADGQGLGLRVSPVGHITFQYRYRFGGAPRRLKYGTYPEMSLSDARTAHREARKLLDRGIDPARHKLLTKREETLAETVAALVQEFKTRYIDQNHKTDEAGRMLDSYVIPEIGKLKAREVTRRELVQLLDKIVSRGARVQANRVTSLVKLLFQYGVERGIIESNPAADIRRRTIGGIEVPRERNLSFDEIKSLWNGLDDAFMSPGVRLALRILLLTGQRRGELQAALKRDVDLSNRLWTIPAENSKNGKAHQVPSRPIRPWL